MKINEYWRHFMPMETYWKYLGAFLYISIGITGLVLNSIVLIYLIKYVNWNFF
jgi:hypothetical protein